MKKQIVGFSTNLKIWEWRALLPTPCPGPHTLLPLSPPSCIRTQHPFSLASPASHSKLYSTVQCPRWVTGPLPIHYCSLCPEHHYRSILLPRHRGYCLLGLSTENTFSRSRIFPLGSPDWTPGLPQCPTVSSGHLSYRAVWCPLALKSVTRVQGRLGGAVG